MTVLDFLVLSTRYIEVDEGVVITMEDGQMLKLKNLKYLHLHGLIGPDAFRENLLIASILNDTIDDVISSLPSGPKRDTIENLTAKVQKYYDYTLSKIEDIILNNNHLDRKSFAILNKELPFFSVLMAVYSGKGTADSLLTEHLLKQTASLSSAQEWLTTL